MFAPDTSLNLPDRQALRLVWAGLGLVLAGCATVRPSVDLPPLTTWELRQEVLGAVSDWAFRGRIAVKSGDEGFNGKFSWEQSGEAFLATVSGPLGIGTVKLEGNGQTVILTDKNGAETVLTDPESDLYLRNGWTIPVNSLRYWALGVPDPGHPAETDINDSGQLVSLEQSDWAIKVSRYQQSAGQQMPRTLTVTNPDTRVRLVIDKWMFFER